MLDRLWGQTLLALGHGKVGPPHKLDPAVRLEEPSDHDLGVAELLVAHHIGVVGDHSAMQLNRHAHDDIVAVKIDWAQHVGPALQQEGCEDAVGVVRHVALLLLHLLLAAAHPRLKRLVALEAAVNHEMRRHATLPAAVNEGVHANRCLVHKGPRLCAALKPGLVDGHEGAQVV